MLKLEKAKNVVCSQHFKPENYWELCDKLLLKTESVPNLNIYNKIKYSLILSKFNKINIFKEIGW